MRNENIKEIRNEIHKIIKLVHSVESTYGFCLDAGRRFLYSSRMWLGEIMNDETSTERPCPECLDYDIEDKPTDIDGDFLISTHLFKGDIEFEKLSDMGKIRKIRLKIADIIHMWNLSEEDIGGKLDFFYWTQFRINMIEAKNWFGMHLCMIRERRMLEEEERRR